MSEEPLAVMDITNSCTSSVSHSILMMSISFWIGESKNSASLGILHIELELVDVDVGNRWRSHGVCTICWLGIGSGPQDENPCGRALHVRWRNQQFERFLLLLQAILQTNIRDIAVGVEPSDELGVIV